MFIDDHAQKKQQHQISDETKLILETLELSFPEFKSIELTNQLLEVLCNLVNYQRTEFKKELSIISPILFKGFSRLDSSSESFKYILNSLIFLTDTSNFFQFEKFHFEILHYGIQKAVPMKDQSEHQHQLFVKISHLMAGERLSTSTTSFIVRQPYGIWLLLSTFLNTETFTTALKFVIEICQYHSTNCQQCRKGEVDLFLIKVIKEQKHRELDDLCFQLLTLIANDFCAPCVVESYVSMFQIEGDEVPSYFHKAMKYFVSMLTADLKVPRTMTKLIKTSVIEPSSFDFSVTNGFTLAFWIYVERTSPQYFPSIVSLQDQNDHFFHLFLASNSLRFSHHENAFNKSEQIDTQIKLRQWSLVTITYKVIPPYYYVIPTVDGPGEEEIIDNKVKKALNGPLKISIGGTLENSIDSDIPCILGPFAVYPILQQNHIQDLFSKGIRAIDQIEVTPIYVYNVNNRIENQNPSFSSVLTTQVGLTILFPLFTVNDNLLDSAFEAFSSSLMTDPSVEIEFSNTECCSIIPYLLQERDKTQATYHLYLKFFQLMQNLQTEQLKHQLFVSIMTNFDLWIHSKIENFLLIVKHWSRTLFPSFSSEVSIITPFSSILNQMMIYFHEEDILNAKFDLKNPSSSKCKYHLSVLLQFIATISFDINDFLLLISYINHLNPNSLSLEAAIILREIAHTEPSPFLSFSSDANFLPSLHSLLKIPKVCVCGLEIIILIFTKKIITNISLREEVIFCIEYLEEEVIDKELFGLVVQQTVSIPELFPLSCYLSTFFGDQSVLKMIELFQPSAEYVQNDDFFYPILTSHFLGKEAQYSILTFLVRSNYDSKKWSNINFYIKIVEKLFEDRTRELESVYLNVLVDILMKNENNNTKNISLIKLFTKIAKRFIFFREAEEKNSIFISSEEGNENIEHKNDHFTFKNILSKYEEFEFIQPDTVFGLRFGKYSEWIDSNLSKKIVQLLEKERIGTAISFDLMLAFYLVNDHTKFVEEHFKNFTIPKIRKESLEPFVALLDRKLQRFGIESTITATYRNLKYDDNVFEKFIKKNSDKIKSNSKTFNNDFQTFFINCRKNLYSNLNINQNQLNICVKSQKETVYKIVSKSLKNEKNWREIRLSLTLPFAPWCGKNDTDFFICRNTRLCGIGFPILSKVQSHRNLPYFNKENETKMNESTEDIDTILTEIESELDIELNEIKFKSECEIYQSNKRLKTKIIITSDRIILIFNRYKRKVYFQEDIIEINTFIIQKEDSGIEIFYKEGKSILLDFKNKSNKENAMNILQENVKINNIDLFKFWRTREITTFDFLLRLNRKLSRSFNYPLRSPIFPPFLINDDNKTFTEKDDEEIISTDLSNILHSSLQQKPLIETKTKSTSTTSTSNKIKFKIDENLNNENEEIDEDKNENEEIEEEEENDENEIAIDVDDLDDSKMMRDLNNFRMSSSSLIIKTSQKKKKETEHDKKFYYSNENKKQIPKITNQNNNNNNNNKFNQHFPGSFGRFVKKSSQMMSANQDSNLNLNLNLNLNSSNEMVTSNSISSMNSTTSLSSFNNEKENSLKLSEICSVLSEGGVCSIDFYTKKSKFYERRKILESDDVSANLNLWLSKVFKLPPISMRIPRKQRTFKPFFIKTKITNIKSASISITTSTSATSKTTSTNVNKTKNKNSKGMNFFNFFLNQDQEDIVNISIDIISKDGNITKYELEKSTEGEEYEIETSVTKINKFEMNWNSTRNESLSSEFEFLIPEEKRVNKILIYDKNNNDYIEKHLKGITNISIFSTSETYFVIATETSSIEIYNKKNIFSEAINTHKIFESPILCCAISETFHTIVVGSEGCLIISSLESGTSIISINIENFIPNKILITENFGFIVTQASKVEEGIIVNVLFLHNIEGKLINKKYINCEVLCLITWSDGEGLDFLSISDQDGKIMSCEAYELKFSIVVKRCMSPVIKMEYCKYLKSLVAITSNGNIFIEPLIYNNIS